MTENREIKYICPYCNKEFSTTIYDKVIGNDDIDGKQACLSGDLFKHLCPHCHKDFMIQNPFVYIDHEAKYILWLSEEELPSEGLTLGKEMSKKGYTLRRCKTIAQLVEKIEIFDDGISDVLVELAKYDSFIEFIDNRKGNPEEVTSVEYQKTKDDVMKINVRCEDKGLSFLIPIGGLEEELRVQEDLFQVDNASFPVVDADWIISLFRSEETQA